MKEAYEFSIDDLYKKLKSSEDGISEEEAKKRLEKNGKNEIKEKKKFKNLKNFLSQFNSFLIYILIFASGISFLIGHSVDGIVISSIVLLNAFIGFFQQYKAEKALQNLKKLIVAKTRVLRNGIQMNIPNEEIVVGDIVILEAGDKISADMRIIESQNASTNEAILTGESLPVSKNTGTLKSKTSFSKIHNMLFTGTNLVTGTAKAIVVSTGMNTTFGKIAKNLEETNSGKTPIQKRLDNFSKQVGLVILGLVFIILSLGFLEKFDLVDMFLTSTALAVSAIPEGLPAVLTISFAISSLLMSKKNVVIRRLPAVEALGSVTVICSDKTGTLTKEKMQVDSIFANNLFYSKEKKDILLGKKKIKILQDKTINLMIKSSILCNNARYENFKDKYNYIGDPTEIALVENSLDLGYDKKTLVEEQPSIQKFEFDSKRKMMSILRKNKTKYTLYSKGAIEKILDVSTKEFLNGKEIMLTKKRREEILFQAKEMEKRALRVLAFAKKDFTSEKVVSEKQLTFLGFMGMIDPPRPEIKDAIKACKDAGIKIKIITGDSQVTAKAIANKIGIYGRVINEDQLEKMSDHELEKEIEDIIIFARTTPEQKLRITRILQKIGETVAITGDGVNDVLALKSADVGVAMGIRGSDVSREVADIILVDDNFASIVKGVEEGRTTYDNIKKFTKYLLAVNFSEIFLIFFSLIFGLPLPLIPLQILWMNLVSDSFPSLSLVFEKGENVMKSKPRNEKSILSGIWKFLIFAGILAFLVELIVFLIGLNKGLELEKIRTLVLTTAIMYELFFVYTCRSKKPLLNLGIFSNKWLNVAVFASLILHVIFLYCPINVFFNLVPLTLKDWLFVIPFAISGTLIFELSKYLGEKKVN